MSLGRSALAIGIAAALTGCATSGARESLSAEDAPVLVDLRVRDNPTSPYRAVDSFTVPDSHIIGDGMMPYEGIGWENGLVGYRLYLDGRLVSDIFGKQRPDPALGKIEEYGSYHVLAPWGMDVLKVGPSLGLGGLGVMRAGQPTQFGTVPELTATIGKSGGTEGAFVIDAAGIDLGAGVTGSYSAAYEIGSASPLTRVHVKASTGFPLASGIVMHDGAEFLQSGETSGAWRYIATWGANQSENKDGLGMALFYRADQGSYGGLANATHFVAFKGARFDYAFLAAWERDPSRISSRAAFEAMLKDELQTLEGMKK